MSGLELFGSLIVYGIVIASIVWFIKALNAIVLAQREMVEQLRIIAQRTSEKPEPRST
jgi:hypothetical protein